MTVVTDARQYDSKVAKTRNNPKGPNVVFDKGYSHYQWFSALIETGVHIVTRFKKNAKLKVVKRDPDKKKQWVTSDQIIRAKTRIGSL